MGTLLDLDIGIKPHDRFQLPTPERSQSNNHHNHSNGPNRTNTDNLNDPNDSDLPKMGSLSASIPSSVMNAVSQNMKDEVSGDTEDDEDENGDDEAKRTVSDVLKSVPQLNNDDASYSIAGISKSVKYLLRA